MSARVKSFYVLVFLLAVSVLRSVACTGDGQVARQVLVPTAMSTPIHASTNLIPRDIVSFRGNRGTVSNSQSRGYFNPATEEVYLVPDSGSALVEGWYPASKVTLVGHLPAGEAGSTSLMMPTPKPVKK